MQRQAESDEKAIPQPEAKEQPPKNEDGIKTNKDSENSIPTNLVAGDPIPRPPVLDHIKPVSPTEQMKRIRGYESRRGRGRGRGGRGQGRRGGAGNEEESPDEVEVEAIEEKEKPAAAPKRRSKRKAEEKEGKMKAKKPTSKAKAKAVKKSEPKEKAEGSEKKRDVANKNGEKKEGPGRGDEKSSGSASMTEAGKALEGTGVDTAEPVEKKRRKNEKNADKSDKSTSKGKADQVAGREKKRSAGELDRKATIDYSKKKRHSKSSKISKKPSGSAVTGSKKKVDAELAQEQVENKKKLSRKSAAYHRARKAALLEGKSEAEAKQEGKEAWVHSSFFF